MRLVTGLFFFLLLACCTQNKPTLASINHDVLVFVGTYTQKLGHVDGKATGIYTCRFDTLTGVLSVVDSVTDLANPSFVNLSPDHKTLYAVGENGGKSEQPFGSAAAYAISAPGKLSKINEVSSYGIAPCHVSTDRAGKFVFVANYGTGNIVSYRINADKGLSDSLCMFRHPAKTSWAHQVVVSPDNKSLFAVDKGADRVFIYDLLADGRLQPTETIAAAKGAGPRHIAFNPTNANQWAVIRENNSTIATYHRDPATRKVTCTDSTSTLPATFTDNNSGADIHFHPNGRFLYGSNRGHNSIAVFQIEPNGKLLPKGQVSTGGQTPRNFALTADGKWLLAANQNSSTVQVFRIDSLTGMLVPQGAPQKVPTPVCLMIAD